MSGDEWARLLHMTEQWIQRHVLEEEIRVLPAARWIPGDQTLRTCDSGFKGVEEQQMVTSGTGLRRPEVSRQRFFPPGISHFITPDSGRQRR